MSAKDGEVTSFEAPLAHLIGCSLHDSKAEFQDSAEVRFSVRQSGWHAWDSNPLFGERSLTSISIPVSQFFVGTSFKLTSPTHAGSEIQVGIHRK